MCDGSQHDARSVASQHYPHDVWMPEETSRPFGVPVFAVSQVVG